MSSTTPTEQKLQALVAERLKIAPGRVPLDQSLLEDLGLDSFDVMGIILEIEEVFAPITISDKSAAELRTLRELAAHIDAQAGIT